MKMKIIDLLKVILGIPHVVRNYSKILSKIFSVGYTFLCNAQGLSIYWIDTPMKKFCGMAEQHQEREII